MAECPNCNGHGRELEEYIDLTPRYIQCGYCEGTGEVTQKERDIYFGHEDGHRRFVVDVDGYPMTIKGDPNMSAEDLGVLMELGRAAIRAAERGEL